MFAFAYITLCGVARSMTPDARVARPSRPAVFSFAAMIDDLVQLGKLVSLGLALMLPLANP